MKAKSSLFVLLVALAMISQVPPSAVAAPTLSVTPTSGPVGTVVTVSGAGLPPGAEATILWWTMEGNRVSGVGYAPASWELGTTTVDATGRLTFQFSAPRDVGGVMPHRIEVVVSSQVLAEAEFVLERSMTLTPDRGPEGTIVHFEMEGGGWTQMDNIVAITYDNAFIGYACSFTNQGHISVWLQAVGAVGTHLIGIYPSPYNGPRSWDPRSNPEPYKHPALNPADIPTIYEPEFFTFEITESSQSGRSQLGGAVEIHEVLGAGDALLIPQVPATVVDDGTPRIGVGNGGQGVVGGPLLYALAGFPPGAQVTLRWDTRDARTEMGGEYGDAFLGWLFTETYATLGTVTVDATGRASGSVTIPDDFGNDHLLEALVDGQSVANTTFKVIGRFTASLNEDGSQILLRGMGLGWEKYTTGYNVLYDGKPLGFITALTTRGTADVSIPVIGEAGLHSVEVFGGHGGFPFLNKHETSWPWERVYRFAFTIAETSPQASASVGVPTWVAGGAIVLAAIAGIAVGSYWRRRKTEVPITD